MNRTPYQKAIIAGYERAKARKAKQGIYVAFNFSTPEYTLGFRKGWNEYIKEQGLAPSQLQHKA